MPVTSTDTATVDLRRLLDGIAGTLAAAARDSAMAAAVARASDPQTAKPLPAYVVARIAAVEERAVEVAEQVAALLGVVEGAFPHDPAEPRRRWVRITHPSGAGTRGGWVASGALALVDDVEATVLVSGGLGAYAAPTQPPAPAGCRS